MEIQKHSSHRIAALVFLASTLATTYFLYKLNFTNLLALTGGLFTGTITTGTWLEVSYRFLVKQATAPLDKLVEKV
ncbi:MAG: hypothetical protein ABEK10_00285 [Candidatus Nanosalina sp.]